MGIKFNPFTSNFDFDSASGAFIPLAEKGTNNGVAELDGGGKVPVSQLPNSIMQYKSLWDASTNTPALADGVGNADEDIGNVYRVSVNGTQNLGSGAIIFAVGDYIILNDSKVWEKADTTDSVVSVNSQTGIVVLDTDDIAEGTNLYFTTARARTAAVADAIVDAVTNVAPSQNAVFDALALKANTTLDNLGTTAINADLLPATASARSLGADGNQMLGVWSVNHDATGNGANHTVRTTAQDQRAELVAFDSDIVTPSATAGAKVAVRAVSDGASGGSLAIFTSNKISTNNSGDLLFETGNTVTGNSGKVSVLSGAPSGAGASGLAELASGNSTSGNSGNVLLKVGSAGGTQGDICFLKTGVSSVVGQVWTATGTAGEGYWSTGIIGITPNVEYITLSAGDITAKQITLAAAPYAAAKTVLDVISGGPQMYTTDYTVSAAILDWTGLGLDGVLIAGDVLRVMYWT